MTAVSDGYGQAGPSDIEGGIGIFIRIGGIGFADAVEKKSKARHTVYVPVRKRYLYITFPGQCDLIDCLIFVVDRNGNWHGKQPVFIRVCVAFHAPDPIAAFHGHRMGIADLVSDSVGLSGDVELLGIRRPADDIGGYDGHQDQNGRYFNQSKALLIALHANFPEQGYGSQVIDERMSDCRTKLL